jgi:hypothetical protein
MSTNHYFSEVVASSLNAFDAVVWHRNYHATFGSLVSVQDGDYTLFGVVYQIKTSSIDPTRQPVAYQKTMEELEKEQPQIFEFLTTTVSCVTVGYAYKGKLFYMVPPMPPQIHSFISLVDDYEKKRFFSDKRYLHVLFCAQHLIDSLDELLLAIVHQQQLSEESLAIFIQTYSLLTGNDYRRIKLFVQRAEQR